MLDVGVVCWLVVGGEGGDGDDGGDGDSEGDDSGESVGCKMGVVLKSWS